MPSTLHTLLRKKTGVSYSFEIKAIVEKSESIAALS